MRRLVAFSNIEMKINRRRAALAKKKEVMKGNGKCRAKNADIGEHKNLADGEDTMENHYSVDECLKRE